MSQTISKISLLMPTRGRTAWATRFLKSVADCTTSAKDVEIILYVDDDDLESHAIHYDGLDVQMIIGPRKTMGIYNSECFAKSSGDIIVLVNDDMVIQTKGWDDRLRALDQSINDGIYLAYGNDLFKKGDLCTFPILSRRTCELLIQPYHHAYRGAFIDYHLMDIFKRLQHAGSNRIHYLDDVIFEHLHFRTGKALKDITYSSRGRFDDDHVFLELSNVRRLSAKKLSAAINKKELPFLDITILDEKLPGNLLGIFFYITKNILFDLELPFKWKLFLWYWFIGRYIASQKIFRKLI